jgi:hypothetical protein
MLLGQFILFFLAKLRLTEASSLEEVIFLSKRFLTINSL